jgi:hypothetical protein
MAIEIDLGVHGQDVASPELKKAWKPPRHVYFGPKDPQTGEMLDEPVYVHQEYPRAYYAKSEDGQKIIARLVYSDEDRDTLPSGWVKMPGDLGFIGAPSIEQAAAIADEDAATEAALEEKNAAIALGVAIKRRQPK